MYIFAFSCEMTSIVVCVTSHYTQNIDNIHFLVLFIHFAYFCIIGHILPVLVRPERSSPIGCSFINDRCIYNIYIMH